MTAYLPEDGLFHIPVEDRWELFVEKFKKLNKKARRLGCKPCTFEIVGEQVEERTVWYKTEEGEYSKTYQVLCRLVRVAGEAPRLADWRFVARVEPLLDEKTGETVSLIHAVPGVEGRVDQRFRSLGPAVCEHCNSARKRRDVFIVRHTDGTEKQVGRQCLADFTGINSPEKAAATTQWLCQMNDLREFEGGWRTSWESGIDTLDLLSVTAATIRAYGWVPKSSSTETPTSMWVQDHFSMHSPSRAKAIARLKKDAGGVQDQDRESAARTMAWIRDELCAKAGRSDYEENLVQLALRNITQLRHVGIVASALATYLRVKSNAEQRKLEKEQLAKMSQHRGDPGQRLRNIPAKILSVRPMAGDFGPTTMVKFLLDGQDVATWFASGDWSHLVPGTEHKITGTVKRHTVYNDVRETALSRVIIN